MHRVKLFHLVHFLLYNLSIKKKRGCDMAFNTAVMQYFEWYLDDDGKLWQQLAEDAEHLNELGITHLWMPPAFKGTGTNDVGYGVYDLYDLGEFDQQGTVRTKYGTKDEYIQAIRALKDQGIKPIADVVLNHRANGDEKERFPVLKMDPNNRQQPISDVYEIEGWTHFTFPGRKGKYSDFTWHYYHFSGIDYDALNEETGIFMIMDENHGWADNESVDDEKGNYDYLMFCDVDYSEPEVVEETLKWVEWYIEETEVEGFRLDAIKHIDRDFMEQFIKHVKEKYGDDFYVFGEYWDPDYDGEGGYLQDVDYIFKLVDVSLHNNFFMASKAGGSYDMRKILDGSLLNEQPWNAVTFVENHDTQWGQSLEASVEPWFKPLAYAMILLLQDGNPTIFYGDYYGVKNEHPFDGLQYELDGLLYLRKYHAYGEEIRYFDDAQCIGWTRLGNDEFPNGLAVIMTNGDMSEKQMHMGRANSGKKFVDYLGNNDAVVEIDENGDGLFPVGPGSVSVWINQEAVDNYQA